GLLLPGVVHPESPHRVVHAGENLHRDLARILADELLVDLQDAAKLDVELPPGNVRQVQIYLPLPIHAVAVQADLEDLARLDVAGDEVAVGGILLFEEIPALPLRDRARVAP